MSAAVPAIGRGGPEDAAEVSALFLAARAAAMPYLPRLYTDAETTEWFRHIVLKDQRVWLAREPETGGLLGFAALDGEVLEHLYVRPDRWSAGVGSLLLERVRAVAPRGLRLHVFQRNTAARAFYERRGFALAGTDDGARNEEREPDATYAWTPAG